MEYWVRNFRFQILDFRLKIQFEICNLRFGIHYSIIPPLPLFQIYPLLIPIRSCWGAWN